MIDEVVGTIGIIVLSQEEYIVGTIKNYIWEHYSTAVRVMVQIHLISQTIFKDIQQGITHSITKPWLHKKGKLNIWDV